MTYKTAFDFWSDLVQSYGSKEARKIANSYLDCPMPKDGSGQDDKEEFSFRCDLFQLANTL